MKTHRLPTFLPKQIDLANMMYWLPAGRLGLKRLSGRLPLVALIACFFALTSQMRATVLVSYAGGSDPTLQRWNKVQGPSTGVSAQPVTDTGSRPVWQIINTSGGTTGSHELTYRYVQSEDQFLLGWSLKVELRVVGSNLGANSQISTGYVSTYKPDGTLTSGSNRILYAMNFGALATSGWTTVTLSGDTTSYSVSSGGYHEFELRYVPSLEAVEFLIDGVVMTSNYKGNAGFTSPSNNYVFWGNAASAAATRTANYAHVEFSVVPEPGPVALGVIGLGLLFFIGRRRCQRRVLD